MTQNKIGKGGIFENIDFTDHQRRILAAVLRCPSIRRNELADRFNLSPQTMMRAIGPLVDSGVLDEIDELAGVRGKPPKLVSYRNGSLVTLGVTLAADRVIVEFADLHGTSISRQAVVMEFTSAKTQLETLFGAISEASQSLASHNRVVGAVVVVQGYFLMRGRKIVARSDPHGWSKIDLYQELQDRLGIAVTIVNDGKAFAGSLMADSQSDNYLAVLIGTGIGGGIVSDGRLIAGASGNAGEVGRFFARGPNRPTEKLLKEQLQIEHWDEWTGSSSLDEDCANKLDRWLDYAAEELGKAINLSLSLLDFDIVHIGSRIPMDILGTLVERVNMEPLGFDLYGDDVKNFMSSPPKIVPHHINKLSHMANKMAVERFVSLPESVGWHVAA